MGYAAARCAGSEVDQHPSSYLQVVGDGVDGQVAADVAAELGLVADDQPADGGVDPVGADDAVEPTGSGVLEGHLDRTAILSRGCGCRARWDPESRAWWSAWRH